MRYRRFGSSDLVVSEVGFGTWTLVTDWWGRTDDPHDMITAALDAGINFIDTAPVYGDGGAGETILARLPHAATTSCSPRSAATTSRPSASSRASPNARTTGGPESMRRAGRSVAAPARHRPHRPATSCTTRASSRSVDDDALGRRSSRCAPKARCASSASRSVRRSVGSKKATGRSTTARSCRCRPCSTCSSRSPACTFAGAPACATATSRLIARVPHASDTLSGKITLDTVFPTGDHRGAPQPRQHARQLREGRDARRSSGRPRPAARSGRPRSPGSSPTRRSRPCCRRCSRSTRSREYAAASDLPLTRRRSSRRSTSCWARNFDHVDRYVDAAEVERLTQRSLRLRRMRLPADQRRQQLLRRRARACSRSRASTTRRWTRSPRPPASPSRCCTSTSRASARCTSSCSTTPAASSSRPLAEATSRASRVVRERVELGFRAYFRVRGRRPFRVPPAVRHVDAHRSRVRRASSTRSSQSAAETIATLIEIPGSSDDQRHVLANALVGMAEVGRPPGARGTRRPRPTATSSRPGSPSSRGSACRGVRAATAALDWTDACGAAHPSSTGVIGALSRARGVARPARRRDVLAQVDEVDLRHTDRAKSRVASSDVLREEVEVRARIVQRRLAQQQQPVDVPVFEILLAAST